MSSSYLDRYGRSKSICHRLPARLKIGLTLVVVVVGISIPVELWPIQGVLACLVFAGHSLANIPMNYLFRRLAIFFPMMLLLSISLPATRYFSPPPVTPDNSDGWEIMFAILFRSTLAFISLLWLVNVMPFDQLLHTLRQLWVPDVLVAMLSFMYRYIFVLWNELEKMRTARKARTFGSGGFRFRWKTSAEMIGMLLIRAMERAERVHGAMCARGWDGRVRTLEE